MSRGSFGRTVARAAASGGSKSYRARPPIGWYLILLVIVVVGVGLVGYSRNEVLHPKASASTLSGPSATDDWNAAFAVDLCGTAQPNLPANSNLTSVGLRTYGDGLINIDPGAVSSPTTYEDAKATLGLFASSYPKFTLTADSIQLPGTKQTLYKNGDKCTSKVAGDSGAGEVQIRVWKSTTAKTSTLYTDPADVRFQNGMMITVAFAPKGATIPQPASKAALVSTLSNGSTKSSKK